MTDFDDYQAAHERYLERQRELDINEGEADGGDAVDYVERAIVAREAANAAAEWWRGPFGQARLAEIRQLAAARRAGTVPS